MLRLTEIVNIFSDSIADFLSSSINVTFIASYFFTISSHKRFGGKVEWEMSVNFILLHSCSDR